MVKVWKCSLTTRVEVYIYVERFECQAEKVDGDT